MWGGKRIAALMVGGGEGAMTDQPRWGGVAYKSTHYDPGGSNARSRRTLSRSAVGPRRSGIASNSANVCGSSSSSWNSGRGGCGEGVVATTLNVGGMVGWRVKKRGGGGGLRCAMVSTTNSLHTQMITCTRKPVPSTMSRKRSGERSVRKAARAESVAASPHMPAAWARKSDGE